VAEGSIRFSPVKIVCPICGVEVEVATLVERGNTHFFDVFPPDMEEVFRVIDFWKTRIPKTRVDLENIHIHVSFTNLSNPRNIGDTSSYLWLYKDGKELSKGFAEADAIHLQLCPGIDDSDDDQLEYTILNLLVKAAFMYRVNTAQPYVSPSTWEAMVDATCQELIAKHGHYDCGETEKQE